MADTKVPFRKMHGLGNDFVVIDARSMPFPAPRAALQRIADRRRGIGCDQLIVLEASPNADARMRIFNPDGGEVGACGNATRCIGKLLADEKGGDAVTIETRAGLLLARVRADEVIVDMGMPGLDWQAVPLAGNGSDTARVPIDIGAIDQRLPGWFSAVNMGNPHAVFFVEDCAAFDLDRIGPVLETHPFFPEKANVSLAEANGRNLFKVRVWERAAGATLACGTAACAVAVAGWRLGLGTEDAITIALPGGSLVIERAADGHILMRGPAATSFTGTIDPSLLAPEVAA
jgi:diaminopimelate epimerase